MADWHVSGSESEGEEVGTSCVEVGALRIPPSRLSELLQTIEKRKTLDLECLAGVSPSRRDRRRRHNKHRRKNDSSGPAATAKTLEEVSETASELRSTTSTDAKEARWNNVSRFDYFHEDETGTDLTVHKRQRKLPPGNKPKKLASLDQIVADVKQQRQRHQLDSHHHHQSTTPEISLLYQQHHYLHSASNSTLSPPSQHEPPAAPEAAASVDEAGFNMGSTSMNASAPLFDFGDDSDLDSPTGGGNMKMSVLTQINRIEKLLDDEGLT